VDASPDGLAGKEATFSLCSFWYNVALLPGYSGVSLAYRRELRASADRWSTSASPAPWARWAGPALLAGSASVFQRWPDSHPPTCLASRPGSLTLAPHAMSQWPASPRRSQGSPGSSKRTGTGRCVNLIGHHFRNYVRGHGGDAKRDRIARSARLTSASSQVPSSRRTAVRGGLIDMAAGHAR